MVEGKDSLSPGGSLFLHILSFLFQISKDPIFVPGVWGPYFSAMVPGFWLNEGGQSVTGKLVSWYFLWLWMWLYHLTTYTQGLECWQLRSQKSAQSLILSACGVQDVFTKWTGAAQLAVASPLSHWSFFVSFLRWQCYLLSLPQWSSRSPRDNSENQTRQFSGHSYLPWSISFRPTNILRLDC